ncbi:MAG: hypothetical protein ACTH2Q_09460 [Propionibacteriaceae bacterium]
MAIYARRPMRLLAQLGADLFVLGWGIVWWFIGRFTDATIRTVAEPARRTAEAADGVVEELRSAGEQAGRVPGVGDGLRTPLDGAADQVEAIAESARAQVQSIEHLAGVTGWLVFLIPVSVLVAIWLPQRIRFFLRARAAQRFIDSQADLDLFALRALANQPMHRLAKVSADPVAAWRSGDRSVIDELARMELRRAGLRPPARADVPAPTDPSAPTEPPVP